jgi:protein SCO1/2
MGAPSTPADLSPPDRPRPPWWYNPYFLATVAGLILIPLMRPLMVFEPDPPPKLADLPSFSLLDTAGEPFGSADLEGRVYVANFIFTRCIAICPTLTSAMARLDRRYVEEGVEGIHLVSVTVDPAFDTPEKLAAYGRGFGVDPLRWTMLTGPPEQVERLIEQGFKTGIGAPEPLGEGIVDIAHSGKFVLVDQSGGIRGYYDTDPEGLDEIFHRSQHVLKESAAAILRRSPRPDSRRPG